MTKLYYQAPSDEIFEEVKQAAIKIWQTYDDTYGYVTEKVDRIKDLENVSDNLMYLVAMFDLSNQGKLALSLSDKARQAISERMISGGMPEDLILF